tara:strand:- start:5048 stop:6310 length:1263 start_codon:yes stop_codon:yes gene_type:complete
MENLLNPTKDYPFGDITIKTPRALQGGTFCANLEINEGPILIQTPKCKTKSGIHKTAKQLYCDLLIDEQNEEFIEWLEKFQIKIQDLIYDNNSKWFHEELSKDDIEYHWNNSLRTYKKKQLLRTFIHKEKRFNKIKLQIYDTDENELTADDLTPEKKIISIIEFVGLKFSSQSFHLDICLRQIMIINEKPIFNKCLIKINNPQSKNSKVIDNIQSVVENSEPVLQNNSEEDVKNELELAVKDEQVVKDEEVVEDNKVLETEPVVEDEQVLETEPVVEYESEPVVKEDTKELVNEIEVMKKETTDEKSFKKHENNEIYSVVEKELKTQSLEKTNDLEEIELNIDNIDTIKLKEPNEVYLDIYKAAREKAKKAKNQAIKAYLEAKKIKELYMLDIIDSSDEEYEDSEEGEEYIEDDKLFSEN